MYKEAKRGDVTGVRLDILEEVNPAQGSRQDDGDVVGEVEVLEQDV
jgi:hypothetical protein